ncbi:MAG TPA: hypothetical protein VMA83_03595 [Solirubrobacteraceae bacterium]|nr:hypothetical protein [Solirubrobacteraceae bacterium]
MFAAGRGSRRPPTLTIIPALAAALLCAMPAGASALRAAAAGQREPVAREPVAPVTAPLAPGARRAGPRYETPDPYALTPRDLRDAYQLPPTTHASAGQTIALVELGGDPTLESDLAVFDREYGLPACTRGDGCLALINAGGGSSLPSKSPNTGEVSLDVDMARAVCEDCHLLVVEGNAEADGVIELARGVNAAADAGATEISVSYEYFADGTEKEEAEELAELQSKYFEHPGTVILASSGDCGYDNEAALGSELGEKCTGRPWNYPGYPAKLPDVVAVGGTAIFKVAGSWRSYAWLNSGSGCAKDFAAPAWQTALAEWPATGCGAHRSISDVAAVASCDPGLSAYDTTPAPDWYEGTATGWAEACGTSAAAPIVAAEYALAGGARGVWPPALTLYQHAGERRAFRDVTSGANGKCGGASECEARVGYDGPTGLGSPIGLSAFSLAGAPRDSVAPRITGRLKAGATITASPGSWLNSPTALELQWQRCQGQSGPCEPVGGARGRRFTVPSADAGAVLEVSETASNASGFGPAATSARATVAPPRPRVTHARLTRSGRDIEFDLSEAARVTVTVEHRRRVILHASARSRRGANTIRLTGARPRAGLYTVLVRADDRGSVSSYTFSLRAL